MSTLFITGGCGFIGANFIRHWLAAKPDAAVVNYDSLTYAGNLQNLADVERDTRYTFIQGDITDTTTLYPALEEHRPQCIVNFAAESHNSRAIMDPDLFFRSNATGTQTLLEAARQLRIPRFHQISTCEVFGDMALDSPEKFTETSPYRPRTPYSASKAAADLEVKAYIKTYGLPATISICANNYGPYQSPEKLIPHFAIKLMRGEKMPLYKDSNHKREWMHVEDHCRAIALIVEKGAPGEVYNVGSGVELDIEEVADRLLEIFQLDASYKHYVESRPSHDRRFLLSAEKIRRELGWEAEIHFDQGFADTVAWIRANQAWWDPLLKNLAIKEEEWKK